MREIEQLRDLAEIRTARQEMLTWYGEPLEALCANLSQVTVAPGAAEAFESLARLGIHTAIVSITWAFAVAWFARRFGAGAWVGTDAQCGEIQHFWPNDKPLWLARHASTLGIDLSEVAAVGDSLGTYRCWRRWDIRFLSAPSYPRNCSRRARAKRRSARRRPPHARAMSVISSAPRKS